MADLTLLRHDDIHAFEAHAMPFLMHREAEHNLFLGICSQIKEGRYTDPYLVTVERYGRVVAAAFRTPPHQLGLSHISDPAAVASIAEDARAAFDELPGVVGGKQDVRAFAECWHDMTGRTFQVAMQQRIYQATGSRAPDNVEGDMRGATTAERDLLISWFEAFHEEVGGVMGSAEEAVADRLAGGTSGLRVWWNAEPASIAGFGGPTPNGIRIGPVYTPPHLRRRGYATACVAALTQDLLNAGRQFVFLFTDLANPTSNSIYQRIGYRPVCDVDQYRFE